MFLNTVHAEWTKLRTTKSFWWTTALIFLIVTGWTLLNSLNAEEAVLGSSPLQPRSLASILLLMGVPIMMIQGAMMVTTEYRYKTQSLTFLANPNRWSVACAKLVVYGVIAAVIAFLGLVYIFVLADLTANESAAEAFQPFSSDDGKHMLWAFPIAAFGAVLFVQGLGRCYGRPPARWRFPSSCTWAWKTSCVCCRRWAIRPFTSCPLPPSRTGR